MSRYDPGKTSRRARDATQDLRIYAKTSYVKAVTVSRGGDRMLGILYMNGFAIRKLPEVSQAGTDACSAAFSRAIGQKCVTRDGAQGMRANLYMDGNRIVKVQSPTHNRDAANKRYVDSVQSGVKPCVSIWAERNGPFSGPYQVSFGGGGGR